jgi:hypothetical protein
MPETIEGFGELLVASLAAVRREAPACARALATALGATRIELAVDDERMIVHAGPEIVVGAAARELAQATRPEVVVATTSRALLALLDGDAELYPAIVDNRVRVRAAPRDAERLFDAMRWFVEGCARARSAPALLAAYRRGARPRGADPSDRSAT